MLKRLIPFVLALVSFVALACVATLIAQEPKPTTDPSLGTWVLNVSRSKFTSPPPKSFVERYELRPDGYFVSTRSIVTKDGDPAFQLSIFKYDGKDYEFYDNSSLAEFLASGKRATLMIGATAIDAYTVEYFVKAAGKIISTGTRTASRDRKTMTFSSTDSVAVFDKQ